MKQNYGFVFLLVLASLFSFSLVTSAFDRDSGFRLISQLTGPKTILFGYIADAPPVSVKKADNFGQVNVSGYCGLLKNYLENEYDIELIEVSYEDRFKRYKNIDVECGPNSITPDREEQLKEFQGKFSTPFFETYTKLLINNNKKNDFQKDLPSTTIGILGGNITSSRIKDIYTQASYQTIPNRGEAIKQLKNGTIDAFANDEILLKSIQKELPIWQYSIFPKDGIIGFGFETYGVVVYDDAILQTNINNWIRSEAGQTAIDRTLQN